MAYASASSFLTTALDNLGRKSNRRGVGGRRRKQVHPAKFLIGPQLKRASVASPYPSNRARVLQSIPVISILDNSDIVQALAGGCVPAPLQYTVLDDFFFGSDSQTSNPVYFPHPPYAVPALFLRHRIVKQFRRLPLQSQEELAIWALSSYPHIAWAFLKQAAVDILWSSETSQDCYPSLLTSQCSNSVQSCSVRHIRRGYSPHSREPPNLCPSERPRRPLSSARTSTDGLHFST